MPAEYRAAEPCPRGGVPIATACAACTNGGESMKGIIAWLLGVPIIVIILLYVTGIF
ncbi:hypothetical protein [Paracoccus aminovorans]|uniref:hypothetical protein n=1 Tax=Paracoccus aminovorans TaxID=34004 RepID=UPI002B256F48|nr:hypothetical protein [Paracoccus aminovorans]